jgi:hypothetical protein
MDAIGHPIIRRISDRLRTREPHLMHFGSSIKIRIALLLAALRAPCSSRRNVFGGALGHSNRLSGRMSRKHQLA